MKRMSKLIAVLILVIGVLSPLTAYGEVIQEGELVVHKAHGELSVDDKVISPTTIEKSEIVGLAQMGYLQSEWYFYNEVYNHENVDLVYDEDLAREYTIESGGVWYEDWR